MKLETSRKIGAVIDAIDNRPILKVALFAAFSAAVVYGPIAAANYIAFGPHNPQCGSVVKSAPCAQPE